MMKQCQIVKAAFIILMHSVFCVGASFQGLGLIEGRDYQHPWAMDAYGTTIVGESSSTKVLEHSTGSDTIIYANTGFVWQNNTYTEVATVHNEFISFLADITPDGTVKVGALQLQVGNTPYLEDKAYKDVKGTVTFLENLNGGTRSAAVGVSADGHRIVGGAISGNGSYREAVMWDDGVISSLGILPSYNSSFASGISADGQVVAGFSNNSDWATPSEAFRWENGQMVGLGYLNGGTSSFAQGISSDGSVLFGTASDGSENNRFEGVRWVNGILMSLGRLDGDYIQPLGASGGGSIIVGGTSFDLFDHYVDRQAFIWDEVNGARSLQDVLISEYNLDLTGWTLQYASHINDAGNIMIGLGENPDGQKEAWIAHIPEPLTVSLLGVGSVIISLRKKYH